MRLSGHFLEQNPSEQSRKWCYKQSCQCPRFLLGTGGVGYLCLEAWQLSWQVWGGWCAAPGSRGTAGQCHLPADSHSSARTCARQQSPVMSARNLRGVRTTCSSLPVGCWVKQETDVMGTGHWAPPPCSWPEVQPNFPALISREQAPALKLSKTGDMGKNVLPRKWEALPWASVWVAGCEPAGPQRGAAFVDGLPPLSSHGEGAQTPSGTPAYFRACAPSILELDKPPKGLAASCSLIPNICRASDTTKSV